MSNNTNTISTEYLKDNLSNIKDRHKIFTDFCNVNFIETSKQLIKQIPWIEKMLIGFYYSQNDEGGMSNYLLPVYAIKRTEEIYKTEKFQNNDIPEDIKEDELYYFDIYDLKRINRDLNLFSTEEEIQLINETENYLRKVFDYISETPYYDDLCGYEETNYLIVTEDGHYKAKEEDE